MPAKRLLVFVAAALALTGCAKPAERRGGRVPITVATVERRPIPFEVEATGTVEASQSATVTARVGGAISRIAFRDGDEVRSGQLLFEIDPRPFRAAVDRTAALLARDRAQAKVAQLELERAVALAARGVVAASELDQKRATAEAAAATVAADSATLAAAQLDLSYALVRSPIDGRAGELRLDLGDVVRAGDATPLLTVHRVRPVHVRFAVPPGSLSSIRDLEGSHLRVDARPADGSDSSWVEGRLVFVDNAVDAASGTIALKGEFANADGAFWPGAFVRVRLRLGEDAAAIVVPSTAVMPSQEGELAYVVKADTTVEVRKVTVARTWRDRSVITTGLEPGETVVTDGQIRLSDGARAAIRDVPAGGR
jgi:multidrug efflux system membrane fusion protein